MSNTIAGKVTTSPLTRHVLRGVLPIIVVAGLLIWLSGGVPPQAWLLLGTMISHWGALLATPGGFASFLVVLLQSILILVAWIMLILVCWHEVQIINDLRAQERIMHLQQALDTEADAASIASPVAPAAAASAWSAPAAAPVFAATPDPAPQMMAANVAPQPLEEDEDELTQSFAKNRGVQLVDNPFEDEPIKLDNPFEDESAKLDNPFDDESAKPGGRKSRSVQISPVHMNENASDDVFSLNAATYALNMDESDPFSAQNNVFGFFLDEDVSMKPKAPAEPELELEEEDEEELAEEGPVFVYGNPFEGELPEVFSYDRDLRNSVEEMQEELRDKEKGIQERNEVNSRKQLAREKREKDIADRKDV